MTQPALCIKDLHKTYDNFVTALKGVSLDVMPGDFFALLGPNGAGKSTMIGVVSSLVNPTSGSVSVFGIDIGRYGRLSLNLICCQMNLFSPVSGKRNKEICGEQCSLHFSKKKSCLLMK